MTKNILLAATALSALAFAGTASAIDITAAKVSTVANAAPATAANAYKLATQSVVGAGLATTTSASGTTDVTTALSTTSGLAVGTYVLRFDYTGMTGFTDTPVLNVTNAGGTCTVATALSSGGGATSTFVEYAVTVTGATCSINPIFELDAGFKESALSAVTVKAGLTLNGVSIDNSSSAVARTIVQLVSGYTFNINATVDNVSGDGTDNADFPTRLALGTGATPYVGFTPNGGPQTNDNIIGALGYAPVAGVYLKLDGTTLATGVVPLMDVTINGSFSGINVRLTTDDAGTGPLTPTSSNASTAQFTGIAGGRYNVTLAAANSTTQLAGGNYNAAFATQANANLNAPIAVAQTGLETVGLEGTNFIAPWLQMQSANYNAIVRISNLGTNATGPISLTLRANNGGTVNQTCVLTSAMLQSGFLVGGGIDQNRAIEFSGRTIANQCFGTTSTNADLQVTIQGSPANLTAKVRIINPDASVSESQLGRLNELGNAF